MVGEIRDLETAEIAIKAANADVKIVVEESPSAADAIVNYAEKNGIDLICDVNG